MAASSGACKKDEESAGKKEAAGKTTADPGGTAAEQAAGTGVVGEALMKHGEDCWASVERWDKVALGNCFTDKPEISYVDAVLRNPKASTRSEVVVETGVFRNGFLDFKAERAVILVNGHKTLAVWLLNAKHKSGKPVSVYQVQVADHDPEGRVTKAEFYTEEATILHQLGVLESAAAPKTEKPWGTPVRQIAKGDDAERGNLDIVKKGIESLSKGDLAAAQAMYADDAVLRYVPEVQPYTGAAEIQARLKATADLGVKLAVGDAWAAGDWVTVSVTSTGTAAQDAPGAKGSKGKTWTLHSQELFRLAGGKVKEHWIFANALKWAFDVGLFDPSTIETTQ